MPRVAILGSCITRDLWPVRQEGPSQVLYISRTSLPSLFGPPVAGFRASASPPSGLHKQQHRALVADLTKTAIAQLVAYQPTHLIFDFIDERFDLLHVGDASATYSWELGVSGYLEQAAFAGMTRIARLSAGCARIWDRAALEFAALVRATPLRQARLILHSARWAEASRSPSGPPEALRDVEVYPGRPVDIAAHNALLAHYEERFTQLMPAMARVEAPAHRLADAEHRWGLSPFHYVPAYYAVIADQLRALGVPVSEPTAAPSVPAG